MDEGPSVGLDETARYVLHRFMYENMEKIGSELKATQPTLFKHWHDGTEKLTPGMGQEIWEDLHRVLVDLGPPGSNDPDLPLSHLSGSEYYGLLAKFELLKAPDQRLWESAFFEAPRARVRYFVLFQLFF